jgi:formylglycine-generating enzyme required for sulfatase activity
MTEETPLEIWKRKLRKFEIEEAITANRELKFELEEKIKECKLKIYELENRKSSPEPPAISRRRLLQLGGTAVGIGGTIILADNLYKWISPAQKSNLSQMTFEVITVNKKGEITTKEPKTAEYFEEDLGKGVMLKMVDIPAGTFLMGSPDNEKGRLVRESPQRRVNVPTFFMGETLVTQAQWRAVASLPPVKKALELNPSLFKGDELPVERVSWQDAIEFCARLSRYTKKNYRLPSEAEWEYACRAGTTTPFHFGETITSELANYNASVVYQEELAGKSKGKTTPVTTFSPNAFGLYDMHGNVWELCLDPWNKNYEGAPKDGSVWDNKNKDNIYPNILDGINILIKDPRERIIRGGSWYFHPQYCRSASRSYLVKDSVGNVGFRLALSVQDS